MNWDLKKFKALMKESGLMHKTVALHLGMSPNYISKIISGKRTPAPETGERLVVYLKKIIEMMQRI